LQGLRSALQLAQLLTNEGTFGPKPVSKLEKDSQYEKDDESPGVSLKVEGGARGDRGFQARPE
jgi:hypothetical protein